MKLTNLRLKKDALDKFSLPVDVVEGQSVNPSISVRRGAQRLFRCLEPLNIFLCLLTIPSFSIRRRLLAQVISVS